MCKCKKNLLWAVSWSFSCPISTVCTSNNTCWRTTDKDTFSLLSEAGPAFTCPALLFNADSSSDHLPSWSPDRTTCIEFYKEWGLKHFKGLTGLVTLVILRNVLCYLTFWGCNSCLPKLCINYVFDYRNACVTCSAQKRNYLFSVSLNSLNFNGVHVLYF